MEREAKKVPQEIQVWANNWVHAVKSSYMSVSSSDIDPIVKLSSIICLVDKEQRQNLFWALSILLINKNGKRERYWSSVPHTLPKTPESLVNLSQCVNYYEKLALEGHFQSLKKGMINPVTVVETINTIGGGYKPYLDLYKDSYYTYPAKIFSSELVKKAAHKLRGRFGDFGEQHSEFSKEIESSLESYDA